MEMKEKEHRSSFPATSCPTRPERYLVTVGVYLSIQIGVAASSLLLSLLIVSMLLWLGDFARATPKITRQRPKYTPVATLLGRAVMQMRKKVATTLESKRTEKFAIGGPDPTLFLVMRASLLEAPPASPGSQIRPTFVREHRSEPGAASFAG